MKNNVFPIYTFIVPYFGGQKEMRKIYLDFGRDLVNPQDVDETNLMTFEEAGQILGGN